MTLWQLRRVKPLSLCKSWGFSLWTHCNTRFTQTPISYTNPIMPTSSAINMQPLSFNTFDWVEQHNVTLFFFASMHRYSFSKSTVWCKAKLSHYQHVKYGSQSRFTLKYDTVGKEYKYPKILTATTLWFKCS